MLTHTLPPPSRRQAGFGMIEVLVTLVILLVGLLGLAGVMVQSQRSELESYQRAQALILAQDMAARINMNRNFAPCYAYTNNPGFSSPWLGTGPNYPPAGGVPACAAMLNTVFTQQEQTQLQNDIQAWSNMLLGAAETSGGNNVGALINARGCVAYDPTTVLPELDVTTGLPNGNLKLGTGVYTVTVAWQGLSDTTSPSALANPLNCAQGQIFPTDARRRAVSYRFRVAAMQ